MQQHIFERYEKKYLLSAGQYKSLMEKLEGRIVPDRYGKGTVLSVYYDTPDFRLIRASLEKPVYKEKLRMRSYGVPGARDPVFVELKKKYKGIVYKRREEMPLEAAEEWLAGQDGGCDSQIGREISYAFRIYPNLAPAMFISCERLAFDGVEDPLLRITFDEKILFRREKLTLSAGAWGEPLLESGQRLMEIKMPGAMPVWLSGILDELKLYPTSFSKYGTAFTRILMREKTGGIKNVG